MLRKSIVVFLSCIVLLAACEEPAPVISSTLIANAMIHSRSGSEPFHGAIRIDGDRITEIGDFEALEGETVIDAGGLALAPGFVAMQDYYDGDFANAIYEMTGLPTTSAGDDSRGHIRTGYFADLVLFDPGTLEDVAAMQDSIALTVDVNKVWVSGVLVFDSGHVVVQDKQ